MPRAGLFSSLEIAKTIGNISDFSAAISAAVEEQDAATQEIARSVTEAARGTQEVSTNIVSVNEAAAESGRSAAQVLDAANTLTEQGETLDTQVAAFLKAVRAM